MNVTGGNGAPDEVTDQDVDRILAAADTELMAYVREHARPGMVFGKIMELRDASPAHTAAGIMLRARVSARDIEARVGQDERGDDTADADRKTFHALGEKLAADCELDAAITMSREWANVVMQDIHNVRRYLKEMVSHSKSDRQQLVDRALVVNLALDQTCVDVSNLGRALFRAQARGSDRDRYGVRALDRSLIRLKDAAVELCQDVESVPVDLCGADLSRITLPDINVLDGTIWSDSTIWPSQMEDLVRACSNVIGDGIYEIHIGTQPIMTADYAPV